jgi:hypothetical protein
MMKNGKVSEIIFLGRDGIRVESIPRRYMRTAAYDIGSTKKNAEISSICSLGTKIGMRLLLAVFYS